MKNNKEEIWCLSIAILIGFAHYVEYGYVNLFVFSISTAIALLIIKLYKSC